MIHRFTHTCCFLRLHIYIAASKFNSAFLLLLPRRETPLRSSPAVRLPVNSAVSDADLDDAVSASVSE